jgi:hypothetical protein
MEWVLPTPAAAPKNIFSRPGTNGALVDRTIRPRFLIEKQTVAEAEFRDDVFGPTGIWLEFAT